MITKETFSSAPAWTVFRGDAADPGPIFWGLFEINPDDYGFVEDPAHNLDALGVDFTEPELDDEHRSEQPAGADDLDAALAYLRRGGTLCKVPDAPGSRHWRLLVVGKPVPAHDFKIEARTQTGPISWQPYPSYAAAEKALPGVKKQAKALGVIRGSWQIVPIQGPAPTPAIAATSAQTARSEPGSLTVRERMSLRALHDVIEAVRANRGPSSTLEAVLQILANHGIDRGEDLARHASRAATPRVRLMLSALGHVVHEVHSDRSDGDAEEAILEILVNHGIAAADVDKALRTDAPGKRSALSDEEHAALALVRTRIGTRWKAALRRAWESGDYRDIASAGEHLPGVLQRLRNASYFGPSGLATYKPKSDAQRATKPPNASPLDLLGAIEALFIDSPYFPLRIGDRIDVIGDDDVVLAAIRMRGNEAVVEQVGSGARAARARLQVATWLSARIARAKAGTS